MPFALKLGVIRLAKWVVFLGSITVLPMMFLTVVVSVFLNVA